MMIKKRIQKTGDVTYFHLKKIKETIIFFGEFFLAIMVALKSPRKIRWKDSFYYMELCGSSALPIVCLICFSMGLIMGFQGAMQLHKYGGDIFLADAVGIAIVLELGPLMVAMIAIGRAGSAFAAEIGTMKSAEEIDAMITMGFVPSRFLIIPKLIAMLIVIPILTVFGDVAGIIGGMTIGVFKLGLPVEAYFNRTLVAVNNVYFLEGLIKSVVFSVIITAVGCMKGFEAKRDAQGVGRAATSAVVTGIFLVIVADTLLTVLFTLVIK